jgi:hypothetical protein
MKLGSTVGRALSARELCQIAVDTPWRDESSRIFMRREDSRTGTPLCWSRREPEPLEFGLKGMHLFVSDKLLSHFP